MRTTAVTPVNLKSIAPQTTKPEKIGGLKDVEEFKEYLIQLGIDLPVDDRILTAQERSPLASPIKIGHFTIGNRWCIHPMEGWDGTLDGKPTDSVRNRWENFGLSGAKLIWGGEAFAVQPDARANPNQLCYSKENIEPMRELFDLLANTHFNLFRKADDLLVGLQLTHSGRFCKPNDNKRFEPKIAYHHPILDKKFGIDQNDNSVVLTDDDIKRIIDNFVIATKMAKDIGFAFVDVKACHGYLGHEFLSAYDRPGPYGGDFDNRTRFMREIIEGIRSECPGLMIGVRLSAFDTIPFVPDPSHHGGGKLGRGIPSEYNKLGLYPGFGVNRENPLEIDLTEPVQLLTMLRDKLGVALVNITAGSPYYSHHIQRPALYPPCDGYQPPEDPLVGVARQIHVTRELKEKVPNLPMVGTAYTYLQEYLPHVAQAVIRQGWTDFVGIGRMVLSYPEFPSDTLERGTLDKKRICRTFSDCTTGPRSGLPSGCYPLDPIYHDSDAFAKLQEVKKLLRAKLQ